MYSIRVLVFSLATVGSVISQSCPPPMVSQCSDNEQSCSLGATGDCPTGNMCIEVGSTCPEPCFVPAPASCSENQVRCNHVTWKHRMVDNDDDDDNEADTDNDDDNDDGT